MGEQDRISKKRILIAAVKSGSGKTVFTCGLLQLLKKRFQTASHKCGPDYIDPMFHRKVLGIPGTNLDPFFSDASDLQKTLTEDGAEFTVLEGAMGIYDGISGMGKTGSCYDVAVKTRTPVLLLADAGGMGATVVSVLKGILSDDEEGLIRAVVFNRMSQMYLDTLRPQLNAMFASLGREVDILGCIPKSPDIHFESRHLGLVMPDEAEDVIAQIEAFANLIEKQVDLVRMTEIAEQAEPLPMPAAAKNRAACRQAPLKLGVARDEAFCFYYEQNIRAFMEAGVEICYFSPLHDSCLPEGISGLLLGGGYPELFLKELSENEAMKKQVKEAVRSGMPSLAECGGFMYLGEYIEGSEGIRYPMVGLVPGGAVNKGKLTRFGYVTVTPQKDGLLDGPVRAHEFHYFDSDDNGAACLAEKPGSSRSWSCMHMGRNYLWGYPHLYYPSLPGFVERFVEEMAGIFQL